MTEPYPLHWPESWPRARHRVRSKFAQKLPVHSNFQFHASRTLRLGDDPGVAVYFEWSDCEYVIVNDFYREIGDNVRALTNTVAALRSIERHGSGLFATALSGFKLGVAS